MRKIILSGAVMTLILCGFTANANTSSATTSSIATIAATTDWDKLLNDYESYVNQYVTMYKKAMSGDMTAMAEYAKLMEKAQKLADQLDKAKGDMTSAQLQRYLKITQKMASAIQ